MSERIYLNHRLNTRDQFYNEIQARSNKERSLMNRTLQYCLEIFDRKGIYKYQDFVGTLKKFGFKASHLQNYILEFQSYLDQYNLPTNWIKKRCIRKANSSEKNLILNQLAHQFPNELLYFTHQYIHNVFPMIGNIEIFFQEFKNKIEQLNSFTTNNELRNKLN